LTKRSRKTANHWQIKCRDLRLGEWEGVATPYCYFIYVFVAVVVVAFGLFELRWVVIYAHYSCRTGLSIVDAIFNKPLVGSLELFFCI
jgi:uncharacterized membrane protein